MEETTEKPKEEEAKVIGKESVGKEVYDVLFSDLPEEIKQALNGKEDVEYVQIEGSNVYYRIDRTTTTEDDKKQE